jgi:dTMP kinase
MKPFFIVLEGLDGSGTSTQASLLENHFKNSGVPAVQTCEPSAGLVGSTIRLALKRRINFQTDRALFDRQMALLFAADRHDHLYNDVDGIVPTIGKGISVICTRYVPSSYAYHCTDADDWQFIRNLNSKFPKPDLLVYLENHVSNSLERISDRLVIDSYEQAEKLQQASLNYKKYIAEYDGKIVQIDASQAKEVIFSEIVSQIRRL